MKYHRTYIIEFEKAGGIFYYAGKRESKFKNPEDDPYTGSGIVIKRTVKKYGKSCIRRIQWFDHSSREEANASEISLIERLRNEHGDMCCNIAKGGTGNSMEFATEEEIQMWKDNISKTKNTKEYKERASKIQKALKSTQENRDKTAENSRARWKDEEYKQRISQKIRESVSTEEVKQKKREAINRLMKEDPDYSRRVSEGLKRVKRNGPVWEMYHTGELYSHWEALGFPAYKSFSTALRKMGILEDCSQYQFHKPVKQMMEDKKGGLVAAFFYS